jgi:threonine dehydrogenase-like Zn-dependent dehydrogenase
VQIAKLLGAERVIGTSTNAERRGRLSEFGADLGVDTRDPNWRTGGAESPGSVGESSGLSPKLATARKARPPSWRPLSFQIAADIK